MDGSFVCLAAGSIFFAACCSLVLLLAAACISSFHLLLGPQSNYYYELAPSHSLAISSLLLVSDRLCRLCLRFTLRGPFVFSFVV